MNMHEGGMKTYARIDSGVIVEIIEPATWPDGSEIAIEDRFTPQFVESLVDITAVVPRPDVFWTVSESNGELTFNQP